MKKTVGTSAPAYLVRMCAASLEYNVRFGGRPIPVAQNICRTSHVLLACERNPPLLIVD